jgi:hypothetical protein
VCAFLELTQVGRGEVVHKDPLAAGLWCLPGASSSPMRVWRLENDFSKALPQTPTARWGVFRAKPKGLMKGEE